VEIDDIRLAVAPVTDVVGAAIDSPRWDEPAGQLEWSCRYTATHIVDAIFWYSGNLAARTTTETGGPDLDVTATPVMILDGLRTSSAVLATVAGAADDEARGWHGEGMSDRWGFIAMGCDEALVHGYDVALGLGVAFTPPIDVAERTLRRLFPWAPEDVDPWEALLWANGRAALGDRPPEVDWLWHCAPLTEWDGQIRRWR
jgi:hypothetical protein